MTGADSFGSSGKALITGQITETPVYLQEHLCEAEENQSTLNGQ